VATLFNRAIDESMHIHSAMNRLFFANLKNNFLVFMFGNAIPQSFFRLNAK